MKRKTAAILLIVLLLSAVASVAAFAAEQGDDAPAFVLTDVDRNYVFSKKTYGTGWLLIDFYSTTCVNCNKELPHVEGLYEEFVDKGFQVLLMATDSEGLDAVIPFFSSRPTPVKILIDKYQKATGAFGVEALPTMFLVDPEGKIAFKSVGYHEEDIESLRRILSENLNG